MAPGCWSRGLGCVCGGGRTNESPGAEFGPDYGDGPLWAAGAAVDPVAVGVDAELASLLAAHNGAYEEVRLPLDGPGDGDYLAEGTRLLGALRLALAGEYRVVVREPWWGEQPLEHGA